MQRLEVSGAVRPLYGSLGVKELIADDPEQKVKANLMQLGNFIDVFLARHVSGTYTHHHEH